jgi:hypothetical protein
MSTDSSPYSVYISSTQTEDSRNEQVLGVFWEEVNAKKACQNDWESFKVSKEALPWEPWDEEGFIAEVADIVYYIRKVNIL